MPATVAGAGRPAVSRAHRALTPPSAHSLGTSNRPLSVTCVSDDDQSFGENGRRRAREPSEYQRVGVRGEEPRS